MSGKILQVNISNGGVPKRPILIGKLGLTGFEGDRFAHPRIHGGPNQALLLIASETIEQLRGLGFPVFPGALGENLTTVGFNPKLWRSGQQFHIGSARIELTHIRVPCRTLDVYRTSLSSVPLQKHIFDASVKRGDPSTGNWGRSGFYARVTQAGNIAPGDSMVLESECV